MIEREKDYWSEVRAKTETQRVKRTDTQSLARLSSSETTRRKSEVYEAGLKAGYMQATSALMMYLRHLAHYRQPVNLTLLEEWQERVKKWRNCTRPTEPPPELLWERHGDFGN